MNVDLLVDPVSESTIIKAARTVFTLKELKQIITWIRTGEQAGKLGQSLEKMQEALSVGNGKPSAIVLDYQMGIQLYLGVSFKDVYVHKPSFK